VARCRACALLLGRGGCGDLLPQLLGRGGDRRLGQLPIQRPVDDHRGAVLELDQHARGAGVLIESSSLNRNGGEP
jgi:hypothetical protein